MAQNKPNERTLSDIAIVLITGIVTFISSRGAVAAALGFFALGMAAVTTPLLEIVARAGLAKFDPSLLVDHKNEIAIFEWILKGIICLLGFGMSFEIVRRNNFFRAAKIQLPFYAVSISENMTFEDIIQASCASHGLSVSFEGFSNEELKYLMKEELINRPSLEEALKAVGHYVDSRFGKILNYDVERKDSKIIIRRS